MKTVYIDESGYTGSDLLNKEQPFQGASAIYISDSDALELIKKHFPNLKSNELKYRSLVRRKNNWDALLALQKEMLDHHICVSYVCNKRFLLILHFLNHAAEPFYFDRNINFYEDGQNHILASLLYYGGNTILSGDTFDEILSLFQYAMKSKSELSISALVEKIKLSPWIELPEAFGPMAQECTSCIGEIKSNSSSTDGALVVLLSLISRLEVEMDDDYQIVHDKSENLKQYNSVLNKMINHENEITFTSTEITKLSFPLKLKAVSQIDSKYSPGVQLADVLTGGIMDGSKAITGVKKNDYNVKIAKLYRDNQLIHLLPSLNIEQQTKFRKGSQGNQIVSYFSKNFS